MSILCLEVFNPCTNVKGTVKGTRLCLHGVPYCMVLNTLGIVSYNYLSELKVCGTILNRTVYGRTSTMTIVFETSGI